MGKYYNKTISYKNSLLICLAVFLVHFLIEAAAFLFNGDQFDPNNDIFLSFYTIDFRLGFVNRVLIGGLISLFKSTFTGKDMAIMFFINLFILIAVCVPIAAKAYRKGHNEHIPLLEYGALLFLFSPFTISEFLEYWGGYDIFWLFGVFLSLLIVRKKYYRWAIPALCFLAIFNHYGFVLAYLPVIFAVLIYEYVKAENDSDKKDYRALTAVTVAVSFISFVYFVFFANRFVRMDLYELTAAVAERAGRVLDTRYYGVNYFSYGYRDGSIAPTDVMSDNKLVMLWQIFYYHWLSHIDRVYFLHLLCTAAPLAVFFGLSWREIAKREPDTRLKRTYILFIFIQCATLPFIFTSTDPQRWFSHPIFCQFILWYWVSIREPETLHRLDISDNKRERRLKIAFYIYALISFMFYLVYNLYFLIGYYGQHGHLSYFWEWIV